MDLATMQAAPTPGEVSLELPSYITPIGYVKSGACGYCRGTDKGQFRSRKTFYARTNDLSPAVYQSLVDRNWRRSGTLLYKPNQRDSCCPHYTLRLNCGQFRPSRDQRQTINRFNKYITGDAYVKEAAVRYPKSREEARKRDSKFVLSERLHECESQSLKQPPEPAHAFEVTLEPDDFTEEKYTVYVDYQRTVHHEQASDISRSGFRRFLCNSPLQRQNITTRDGSLQRLGSYHQCYRLDGKLVAIGVLDLLPNCVSAVYFLYHQSIHTWSPGKLGALREISLATEGGYGYWYPGFYIHTCPKMRYKIDYMPQEVLDPDSLKWVKLTQDVLAKFDSHGYLHLNREADAIDDTGAESSVKSKNLGAGLNEGRAVEDNDERIDEEEKNDESEDKDEDSDEFHLLTSNMPGLAPLEKLSTFDFDSVIVRLNRGAYRAVDLFDWEDEDIMGDGPKAQIAQLAAGIGLDLMPSLWLDFRRERQK
ncbi:arginine-tRNA-protein transferase [Xylariaceae sp. FL1019]|nr:arginine-tRNA-protein transferase [Xylariaceae sp. FL1019]